MEDIISAAKKEHESALRALWRDIFEDSEEVIDYFFKNHFTPENTAVALRDGVPVSMGFLLPTGFLNMPDSENLPCAMIYGVATNVNSRGRGCAEGVTRELVRIAEESGYSAVVLHPADDGLFGYYENASGFESFFYAEESMLTPDTTPHNIEIIAVSPENYCETREKTLRGTAHIALTPELMKLQEFFSKLYGGGLYAFYSGGEQVGCAIVEISDGSAHAKELLVTEDATASAVGAIASLCDVKSVLIRRPISQNNVRGNIRRFGMIHRSDNLRASAELPHFAWYGPAFD